MSSSRSQKGRTRGDIDYQRSGGQSRSLKREASGSRDYDDRYHDPRSQSGQRPPKYSSTDPHKTSRASSKGDYSDDHISSQRDRYTQRPGRSGSYESSSYRGTGRSQTHKSPCTGAVYILGTLIRFWIIGIVVTSVKFTAARKKVGDVKDINSFQGAMAMIGNDAEAGAWLISLGIFAMATCFCLVYLVVLLGYDAVVNQKGLAFWMKKREARNEGDRQKYKDKQIKRARLVERIYGLGTR